MSRNPEIFLRGLQAFHFSASNYHGFSGAYGAKVSRSGEKNQPWRLWSAVLSGLAAASLIAGSAFLFQDNLARFLINPRTPFQTLPLPPAPEYGARGAWALWPDAQARGAADIFYIHSTTAYSRDYWNAPLADPASQEVLKRTAAPNEVGPFYDLGAVYAPRYRQATLYALFTHKYDGVAAQEAAFGDVRKAFEEFLRQSTDPERPILIVGYGQGGLHALGLLSARIADDDVLRRRLAAAYIIDHTTPPSFFSRAAPAMRVCDGPEDFRCVVSYVAREARPESETRRLRARMLAWTGAGALETITEELPVCVNPLNWRPGGAYETSDAHIGAASATGLQLGETPSTIAQTLGAACESGVLIVDRPRQSYLRRSRWFAAKWKAQPFNLFYHDLRADAASRVARTQAKLTEEATNLAPITEAVEIIDSPINKVPD